MGDVVKAVNNTVSAVSNGVNNVAQQATNTVNNTVREIGRSDVGKVVEAVTAPARGTLRAGESLVRGDIEGAAGNLVHASFAANPINMAAAASSSVRDLYKNDIVNTLTLGYSKDAAEIVEKGKENSYGKRVDASDWSVMGRQAIRGAAIAGAVIAAPVVGSYIAESAAGMTLGEGLTAGAAVLGAAKDPKGAAADLINNYIPGAGDVIGDIYDNTRPTTPTTPTARNPANVGTQPSASPQVIQVGGAGIDTKTLLVIGGVGILGVAGLILLKQR